jgi:hypothetical protein
MATRFHVFEPVHRYINPESQHNSPAFPGAAADAGVLAVVILIVSPPTTMKFGNALVTVGYTPSVMQYN